MSPAAFRGRLRALVLQPGAAKEMAAFIASPASLESLRALGEAEVVRSTVDVANLDRYRVDNETVRSRSRPRAVFLGDSITEYWQDGDPALFGDGVVNRGIGGQTTSQMRLRFPADVVSLEPEVLHLMAGTNDVAGNGGPVSDIVILDNISAMIDLAQVNGIRVALASIPPMERPAWNPDVTGAAPRIVTLNTALRGLAADRGIAFVDYHAVLERADGGMRSEFSNDGVHLNRDGYARIRGLATAALERAGLPASLRRRG